jgi:ferritin-like protein
VLKESTTMISEAHDATLFRAFSTVLELLNVIMHAETAAISAYSRLHHQ